MTVRELTSATTRAIASLRGATPEELIARVNELCASNPTMSCAVSIELNEVVITLAYVGNRVRVVCYWYEIAESSRGYRLVRNGTTTH